MIGRPWVWRCIARDIVHALGVAAVVLGAAFLCGVVSELLRRAFH